MTIEKVLLVDRWDELGAAWETVFAGDDAVDVRCGDFFLSPADAMVSPANSFGIMDGGLDLAIRDRLGFEAEKRVQAAILENHFGELPVGAAVIVPTDNADWPYLVAAPTMRIPESVPHTLNAYLAFRAALVAVWRFNRQSETKIRSLLVPGLATGIGGMSARRCAGQMKVAWSQLRGKPRIPSYKTIHQVHLALKLAD